jgi:serine/threonine-protein kinase
MSIELGSAPSPPPLHNPQAATVPLGSRRHDPQTDQPVVWVSSHGDASFGERVGRYPISGEIARGGMGAILRGHDPNLGRDLAIKVLLDASNDPDQVRRFVEEAQIGGQLQHPGVVPVYEIGLYAENRPYFTMKLVEGRTLFHLLWERTDPTQDLPRFLGIFQHVCQTIAYAHDRGVIHRDLKPGNIMVGEFGEVQVMDWGLAKVLDSAGAAPDGPASEIRTVRTNVEGSASVAGTISGTPAYMAPEQARGENERVDKRADVFALGSILCEILTGRPAYEGGNGEDTYCRALRSDLGDTQARLTGCGADPQLLQLARRCLEPERETRPGDAGVLAREITAYLDGVQERLRQAELERTAAQARAAAEKRSRRLTQTLGGLIALTLLGLALAGGWWAEKRVRLRHDVDSDLNVAEESRANGKWAEARAAAERAHGRLGDSGPDDLQRRLQRVRADLDMVGQLERIRLKQAEIINGRFNREAVIEYGTAFKQFDLDVLTLDAGEAAQRIRASAIAEQLLAALDDWLLALDMKSSHGKLLLDIVQEADTDSRRPLLRSAWAAEDWTTLRELASPHTVAEMPPSTGLFVSAALLRAEAPDEAITLLETAQRAHPADFWLNHRLAYLLDHLTNRQEQAVGYYRAALALRPDSPGVYVNLSVALEHLGRYDEAEDAARKAIQLQDDYAEAYTNLAYFLRRRNRLDEADDFLQKALQSKPNLPIAHWNLFNLRDQQCRFDDAETEMRQAIALEPENAEMRLDFGVFLLKRGRTEAARDEFKMAVRLKPDKAAYHFQAAYALQQLGATKEAEHEYRAGLALDDHAAQAHTNLGALLFDQGRYSEAEKEHRAALAADPKLATAQFNLGVTLARQDKTSEAEKAFQEAITLKADYGSAYYNLGLAQLRQGKNASAAANFHEAIRYEFDNADVRGHYGVALSRLGQHADAENEFRRALALGGEVPEWQCRLGLALEDQGRFREGRDLIRQGHERGVAQPNWNLPSQQWLKTAERNIELEEKLPAVLADADVPKDAAEWLEFARVCQAKKQYAGAVKCYQSAFTANPNLATDYRQGGGRGAAARVAIMAASGQGLEPLDDPARARLRQQALTWLQADVTGWSRGLDTGSPAFRDNVRQSLESMQRDPALAAVREETALEKLPEAERTAFRQLWTNVAELAQRSGEKRE